MLSRPISLTYPRLRPSPSATVRQPLPVLQARNPPPTGPHARSANKFIAISPSGTCSNIVRGNIPKYRRADRFVNTRTVNRLTIPVPEGNPAQEESRVLYWLPCHEFNSQGWSTFVDRPTFSKPVERPSSLALAHQFACGGNPGCSCRRMASTIISSIISLNLLISSYLRPSSLAHEYFDIAGHCRWR
jgi:hypothetical protein